LKNFRLYVAHMYLFLYNVIVGKGAEYGIF
jgi:hypothetical protein